MARVSFKNLPLLFLITYDILNFACGSGGMADAADSKSADGNIMWVQLPSSASKVSL